MVLFPILPVLWFATLILFTQSNAPTPKAHLESPTALPLQSLASHSVKRSLTARVILVHTRRWQAPQCPRPLHLPRGLPAARGQVGEALNKYDSSQDEVIRWIYTGHR